MAAETCPATLPLCHLCGVRGCTDHGEQKGSRLLAAIDWLPLFLPALLLFAVSAGITATYCIECR